MNKEKICPVCSKTFNWSIIRKKQQVTCSRECSNSFFKRRTAKNPTKYNCIVCNKESKIHYGKHAKNLYCSNECYVKNNKHDEKHYNFIYWNKIKDYFIYVYGYEKVENDFLPLVANDIAKKRRNFKKTTLTVYSCL